MRIRWGWLGLLGAVLALGLCGREGYRVYRIVTPVAAAKAPAPVRAPESQRRIAQGDVIGYRDAHGAHVYRALPFAQPPVGPLRWKAPRNPAPWTGVRDALAPAPKCVQPKGRENKPGVAAVDGQEDCLYLEVYAPAMSAADAAKQRLPVMFWIHGGANLVGSAAQTDAGRLAVEQQVIVVATNYRLGPMGWFSHPALAAADPAASPEDRSGNYGTLDLIQSLRWVKENIGAFGGNPDLITVFGVSAGAANVWSLLLAPSARGLFHRAISQSAPLYSYSVEQAQAYTEDGGLDASSAETLARLLIAAGRAADRTAAKALAAQMDAAATASFLRAQKPEALLRALIVPRSPGDDRPPDFATVVRDGAVMPVAAPFDSFASGAYNRVPLLIGTNRDEMTTFMIGNPELVETGRMGVPSIKDETLYGLLVEYRSEAWRASTVHVLGPLLQKLGESMFAYRFDWDEQPRLLLRDLGKMIGATHGIETAFVFGNFDRSGRGRFVFTDENGEGREQLSAALRSYWTEFAEHGAPRRGRKGELPEWKPWSTTDKYMLLDTEQGGGLRMHRNAVTVTRLLDRLAHDKRLPGTMDKCRVLYWLTQRGRAVPSQRYFDTPGVDCSRLPPEDYPWTRVKSEKT